MFDYDFNTQIVHKNYTGMDLKTFTLVYLGLPGSDLSMLDLT